MIASKLCDTACRPAYRTIDQSFGAKGLSSCAVQETIFPPVFLPFLLRSSFSFNILLPILRREQTGYLSNASGEGVHFICVLYEAYPRKQH
jgi:hypothetical protein